MATKEEYQEKHQEKKLKLRKMHHNLKNRRDGTNVYMKIMNQCDEHDR